MPGCPGGQCQSAISGTWAQNLNSHVGSSSGVAAAYTASTAPTAHIVAGIYRPLQEGPATLFIYHEPTEELCIR